MSKKYNFLVFIARMQPYHNGHHAVIKRALELSENVIIVLGSHKSSRTIRNPLTCYERQQLVLASLTREEEHRITFIYQEDHLYNDQRWLAEIQLAVDQEIRKFGVEEPKIGLIGHEKDSTSYYLKLFPNWGSESVPAFKVISGFTESTLNSTTIRNFTFETWDNEEFLREALSSILPSEHVVRMWLHYISQADLVNEYRFVNMYKEQWKNSPYPPTFVTVDSVVTISGHILLVKRGAMPGKGLWALPGGFLDQNERVRDGAVRELYEETKLAVPRAVIEGSIVETRVYDHPNRSSRGRTITHTTHIALKDATKLPKIKGSDDAEKAKWVPIGEVINMKERFFEDHYSMIEDMLGL